MMAFVWKALLLIFGVASVRRGVASQIDIYTEP